MNKELTKEEIQERIENIEWHLKNYKNLILDYWTDEWNLKHLIQIRDKNWMKGLIFGLYDQMHEIITRLINGLTYNYLEEHFLVRPSRRQKEKYSYDVEWTATEFEAIINDIYRQANPNFPEIIEGRTYHSHIKPFALLKVDGNFYGIFADDPGQQDMIRFEDGTMEGFGSYNLFTIETALYFWIRHIKDIGIKRIEDYKA